MKPYHCVLITQLMCRMVMYTLYYALARFLGCVVALRPCDSEFVFLRDDVDDDVLALTFFL
jgi:hypothetical protein